MANEQETVRAGIDIDKPRWDQSKFFLKFVVYHH